MSDTIEKIGHTVVQKGPHNDRIYVMKLGAHDVPWIIDYLKDIALENGYSKIFIKVPASALGKFLRKGYIMEAHVPRLFNGTEDGFFMARYLKEVRSHEPKGEHIREVLSKALALAGRRKPVSLAPGYSYYIARPDDAGELAQLYRKVFATYPFPIFDEGYLKKTMKENIRYFAIRKDDKIIAASSAETDCGLKNVEMTDFATHPDHRGKHLSTYLLMKMEEEMLEDSMKVAYTIARSLSYPVNSLFSKAGYAFGGTLVKNTNICGSFESMNVWYKTLG
ncbi:MAG TPA: putative beta-lysine N-acetyltransferase [Methanocella sp.]|jgi:putative beta-lysine N-acetyltransferase